MRLPGLQLPAASYSHGILASRPLYPGGNVAWQSYKVAQCIIARSTSTDEVFNYEGHTLSSVYIGKQPEIKQLDHLQRRQQRDIREIAEAGRRFGLTEASIKENLVTLQTLLPDLSPNLDRMKASDWAKLISNVNQVATTIIALRGAYPRANLSAIIGRTPKMLLQDPANLQADAEKVKQILSGVEDIDAVVEAVPYLMDPQQLLQSLSNLQRWFPNQDPKALLAKNPAMLMNIEEADLEADPLYGLDLDESTYMEAAQSRRSSCSGRHAPPLGEEMAISA